MAKLSIVQTRNVLSREECQNIINSFHTWERDYIKNDTVRPEKTFTKEELDANTEIDPEGYKIRQVSQAGTDYITEWDGLPVYRCKVMKYEEGDFVEEHRDSLWMCQSNYWKPNTNKQAKDLMVIPLNDDYEGGELTFEFKGKEYPIKNVANTLVIFPSNLLYKHKVTKVTKGTRFAVVGWMT